MLVQLTLTLLIFMHLELVELSRKKYFSRVRKLVLWCRLFVVQVANLICYHQQKGMLKLAVERQVVQSDLEQDFERFLIDLCLPEAVSFVQFDSLQLARPF